MFRYTDTNKVSELREIQRKVVTEARKVTYINQHPDPKILEPVITEGWEIVSEYVVSPDYPLITPIYCASKTVDNRPKEKETNTEDKKWKK